MHYVMLLQPHMPRLRHSILLELLLWGNPILQLLPKLDVPIGYYGAAGDSDVSAAEYVSNSKTARFVGFHVTQGSRYSLLTGHTSHSKAFQEVVEDQTMLLVALLGDRDLEGMRNDAVDGGAGDVTSCGTQQQQLFPFQQQQGVLGLDTQHHEEQLCAAGSYVDKLDLAPARSE